LPIATQILHFAVLVQDDKLGTLSPDNCEKALTVNGYLLSLLARTSRMIQPTKQRIGDLDCIVARHPACDEPKAAVILCHGFGAPPSDLVSLAGEFMEVDEIAREVVFIFPAAPLELDPLFDARAWWMIDVEKIQQLVLEGSTRQMRGESPDLLPKRRENLTRVIDHCRVDFSLPASKVIIGGFSQGAMLSTDVALHYPEPLGGLIAWSGALINEEIWSAKAREQSALTIVQSHGRSDPILPFSGGEDLRDMLTESGHEVRFCEFNGEHSIALESIKLAAQLIGEVASSVPT
jgi:phospholipase/carboxylesterase